MVAIALGKAGLAACKASIQTDTFDELERYHAVSRPARIHSIGIGLLRTLSSPDFIARCGRAQGILQVVSGIRSQRAIIAAGGAGVNVNDCSRNNTGPDSQQKCCHYHRQPWILFVLTFARCKASPQSSHQGLSVPFRKLSPFGHIQRVSVGTTAILVFFAGLR